MPIPDSFGADPLGRIAADLTGPMAAGMRVETLPVVAGGALVLEAPLREAALFLALRADLDHRPLRVTASVVPVPPAGSPVALVPLRFAGWSARGSVLPLHTPAADPATEIIAPFRVTIRAFRDGVELGAADRAALLEGRLVSGRLGRLMALLEAEAVAIRRHARAIAAARAIETADGISLDRHGADLGVPRLTARLSLKSDGTVTATDSVEDDAAYRRRLGLYRAMSIARPAQAEARLGPAGLLARMGHAGSLGLLERAEPFALAVQVVSVAPTAAAAAARRTHFVSFLRDFVLVDPRTDTPLTRRMPAADRTAETALRRRLRSRMELPTGVDAAMAPELARALDRAAALFAALGVAERLRLVRALDPDGGSRFAMGLGAEIALPSAATLQSLHAAAGGPPPADPALRAAFSALKAPARPEDDPEGAWVFEACGLRTVHRSAAGAVFVSPLATRGLVIAGDTALAPAAGTRIARESYGARFDAPAGATAGATLLAAAAAAEAVAGAVLAGDAGARLAAAAAPDAATATRLRAAGLPVVDDWEALRDHVGSLAPSQWAVIALPAATAAALAAGDAAAWNALAALARGARQAGAAAAAPMLSAAAASVLVSTAALPVVGANLTGRASTAFRWYAIPIDRPLDQTGPGQRTRLTRRVGPQTGFESAEPGLYAIVVLGYERSGGTDPFEVRVESGEGETMSFEQYEALMNLLALRAPAGVEINTWPIRRFHVASDDGIATPLDPSAARTYRPWRRPRRAGAPAPKQ